MGRPRVAQSQTAKEETSETLLRSKAAVLVLCSIFVLRNPVSAKNGGMKSPLFLAQTGLFGSKPVRLLKIFPSCEPL